MEELANTEGSTVPPTIYVIKFNPRASTEAVKWLLSSIEDHGKDTGADLVIKSEPNIKKGQGVTIHVTATRLLKNATWQPSTQNQTLADRLAVHEVESLSEAEREYCIRNILMTTRSKIKRTIPGHENILIYPGQSLVTAYHDELLITDLFPLHNSKKLKAINEWCYEFSIRTPKDIQSYFGESVAMYFQFLEFYTIMLIFPAMLGFILHMFSVNSITKNTLFAIFNLVWITIFLKQWKRKCSALAFEWGTLSRNVDQEIHQNFSGEIRLNPITMRHVTYYPVWKTHCKVFASNLIVGICTLFALVLGVVYANGEILSWLGIYMKKDLRKKNWILDKIFPFLPSIIYAVIIAMVNGHYKMLAAFLTTWENHRLQGSYNWHYVTKLLVFEFVNNFSSLFYIAFYDQDWDKLRSWVATMLIVMQLINQFQETILPFLFKEASFNISKRFSIRENNCSKYTLGISRLDAYDPLIEQAEMEAQKDSIEDEFDDYLEMFMQFGYISMFSCAFPMASFYALINNLTELKTDAFKFCNVYQRPKVKRVSTIGVWQDAFELLGVIGVATNCALLCLSPTLQSLTTYATPSRNSCESSQYGNEWILIFVLLEHFILGVKFAVSYIIPDQPKWVREKQEMIIQQNHEAHTKMILKNLQNSPWGMRLMGKEQERSNLNNNSSHNSSQILKNNLKNSPWGKRLMEKEKEGSPKKL